MRHTEDSKYKLTKEQHQIATGMACLYPYYKERVRDIASLSAVPQGEGRSSDTADTTALKAVKISPYMDKIRLIEKTAEDAGGDLSKWILRGVVEKRSYDNLRFMHGLPACKNEYYMRRQYFLWLLYKRIEAAQTVKEA